ncbi:MAG: hypothetical protein HFF89_08955 [Oscillibacter sp.]|nr:hypothetical protein [Oscillibacter sp.]
MKSPKDMKIIQIDITNACQHRCSNCTRFCGHHEKPFFMDFETFKRAVDSMEGYVGIVGMIGGEPTLHPEFERFARYLDSKMPAQYKRKSHYMRQMQGDLIKTLNKVEIESTFTYCGEFGEKPSIMYGSGLFSAMGVGYKKHYETIQDVFTYQAVNDHTNPMYHEPILVSRKDLGIPDDEWVKLRDKCWVNQLWSAGITPKGAFFCEIAGTLDMLLDGPGGWPIEPGWWKREEKDFGDQLQWCELCGVALQTFTRDANEEIDDMSQTLYEKIRRLNSAKIRQGKYNVIHIKNGQITEESKAHGKKMSGAVHSSDSIEAKFGATDTVLYPQGFVGLLISSATDTAETIRQCVKENEKQFTKYMVATLDEVAGQSWKAALFSNGEIEILTENTFGRALNRAMKNCKDGEYLVAHTSNARFAENFQENLKGYIINPGTMHYIDFSKQAGGANDFILNASELKGGCAALFSREAQSLRMLGFDRVSQLQDLQELVSRWIPEKVLEFSNEMICVIPETLSPGKRYVLYGAGARGQDILRKLLNMGNPPVLVVDGDTEKWGTVTQGCTIEEPDKVLEYRDRFDAVVIGSAAFSEEIKERLRAMGLKDEEMLIGY